MIVYCGQCVGSSDPQRLGEFDGTTWLPHRDRHRDRARKRKASDDGRYDVTLSSPATLEAFRAFRAKMAAQGRPLPRRPVERVPAKCPVHGDGWLDAAALLGAFRAGRRRTVLALRTA